MPWHPTGSFKFGGHEFIPDNANFKETVPSAADVQRITDSIREAKKQSDYVMGRASTPMR